MASTVLKALISARHWQRYETFAREFERAADDLAELHDDDDLRTLRISRRQLERWCSGSVTSRPRPNQCRVLEHMFKMPVDKLLAPPSTVDAQGDADVQQDRLLGHASPFGHQHAQGPIARPVTLRDERLDDQVTSAANTAFRFLVASEGSGAGDMTIEQLSDDVRSLAGNYLSRPLFELVRELTDRQELVFELLQRSQKPSKARDLYLLGGILSGLLGKASHDLGDSRSAMTQARTALVCAESAEHSGLKGWAYALHSLVQYWADDPRSAIHYAHLGAASLGNTYGSVAVWLAALEARAHAQLGDFEGVDDSIRRARHARENVTTVDLDHFGGLLTFPRVKELYYTSEAAILLGRRDPDSTVQVEEALHAYETAAPEDWDFSSEAGARANLALRHAQYQDAEAALEALRPVLESETSTHINGVVRSVRRVQAELMHATSGSARELQQAIQEFTPLSEAARTSHPARTR